MDIIIGGHRLAREFMPWGKVYAIRIFGNDSRYDADAAEPLKGKYTFVDTARFDKTSRLEKGEGGLWFNDDLAQAMIDRFLEHRDCDALLVHCYAGEERSPAVAKAFNDKFELNGRVFKLSGYVPEIGAANVACLPSHFSDFPLSDPFVYRILMRVHLENSSCRRI